MILEKDLMVHSGTQVHKEIKSTPRVCMCLVIQMEDDVCLRGFGQDGEQEDSS